MEGIRSRKRLVLAAIITVATLLSVRHTLAGQQTTPPPNTEVETAPTPSKPAIWIMGSILAGLVGSTRFGAGRR